jgi:hypothetical protein
MARIIVTADHEVQGPPPVLLDESVYSVHLSDSHAAKQLIERLGWALGDAEEVERARPRRRTVERGETTHASSPHSVRR